MPEVSQAYLDEMNARLNRAERRSLDLTKALKAERREKRLVAEERDRLKSQAPEGKPAPEPTKLAPASDLERELAEARAKLAEREHRDLFRKEALAKGAKPEWVDDLYNALRLNPGDGPAKPEDLHAILDEAKGARSWAFTSSPEAPPAPQGTQPGRVPPVAPEGTGRSASSPPAGAVRYTAADVAVPGWQKSRPDLATALKEGRAQRVG